MPSIFNDIEKFLRGAPLPMPTMRSLGGIGHVTPVTFYPQAEEIDGKHVLKFPLPGVSKENVSVKVIDGNRVVVGYTGTSEDEKSSEGRVYVTPLPRHADPATAKARSENGVVVVEFEPLEGAGEVEVTID